MDMKTRHSVVRETGMVVFLAVFLSLAYNAFSAKGLSLWRIAPARVEVPDSVLFSTLERISSDTLPAAGSVIADPNVVAPLHQQALRNPDSSARAVEQETEESRAQLKVIKLDQLKRLLAQHRGVLLDARSEEEYGKGHIQGARNVFALEVEKYFEQLVELPRDTLVIIYCNNPECHLARTLAEFMETINFSNLYLYEAGWDGWVAAQMPVDTTAAGEEPRK